MDERKRAASSRPLASGRRPSVFKLRADGYWGRLGLTILAFLRAAPVAPLFGQAQPTNVGLGYELPVVVISPGQIVTLFVAGFGGVEEAHADKLPLPTELAGFQVLAGTPESARTPAPILAVE